MLSCQSLITFQKIYFHEYGVNLSDDEVYELASNLVQLYKAVYIPENNKDISQKYENKP